MHELVRATRREIADEVQNACVVEHRLDGLGLFWLGYVAGRCHCAGSHQEHCGEPHATRDAPVPPPALSREGRSALGEHQKAWLLPALAASTARWRLLGNPSVMARTWNDALPEVARKALVKIKLIDTDGTGPDYDQWDGYPQERREVLRAIGELDVPNVVVLSGDVHVGLAAELAEDHTMPPVAVEFVNTSLSSQNLDDKMGWAPRTDSVPIEAALLARMPQLRYLDHDSHGYSIVELDREQLRFEWWTVDRIDTRSRGHVRSASLSVRHGEPRLIPG